MKPFANLAALLGWIALCLAAGILGAGVSGPGPWYQALQKPSFNPPPWVFAPVWTTLYILMGTAAWLVWLRRRQAPVGQALAAFLLQLAINAAWSPLFFGLQRPGIALIDLILLWITLLITILLFRRIRPAAAWLLLPYLAWVSFAGVLNAAIVALNPATP